VPSARYKDKVVNQKWRSGMAFRAEHLNRAFGAENEHAFTAWAFATPDPLAAVLAKGYFRGCRRQFRPGDLVFCATGQPGGAAEIPADGQGERRRSLLLVTSLMVDGIEVRLVQDWGSPGAAPDAVAAFRPEERTEQPAPAEPMAPARPRRRVALPLPLPLPSAEPGRVPARGRRRQKEQARARSLP
jgi:hypothetical protein